MKARLKERSSTRNAQGQKAPVLVLISHAGTGQGFPPSRGGLIRGAL